MSKPVAQDGRGLATLRTALITAIDPVRAVDAISGPGALALSGNASARLADALSLVLSTDVRASRQVPGSLNGDNRRPPKRGSPQERLNEVPDGDPETRRLVALVDLARAGDRAAFGDLYATYLDTVYRFVLYRVADVSLAEDLTQEVFTRALRRVCTFTWQGRDFGAWLVTIAKNLIADHYKASRTRLESVTGEFNEADDVAGNPETITVQTITAANLRAQIKRLNSQQQECIELRFLHEFSVAETALIMGKNEGAIKTLQYRAIRALLKLILREEEMSAGS